MLLFEIDLSPLILHFATMEISVSSFYFFLTVCTCIVYSLIS